MNRAVLHSTMRELQRSWRDPRYWAVLAIVSAVLGLAGPFGTYEAMRPPARLAYWALTVTATYSVGFITVTFLERWLFEGRARWSLHLLIGAVAGIPVATTAWAINIAVFGAGTGRGIGFMPLLAYCVALASIVSAAVAWWMGQAEPEPTAADGRMSAGRPRLLDRLAPHLRGELRHLSVQDHYVEVHTDRGTALVLMRLSDAIAETEGVPGLRIHRSHWVALAAVARTFRRDGRLFVGLVSGAELPVSRTYVSKVRAAGLA